MRQHVTVIKSDKMVIVDGIVLRFDFSTEENFHALQWHEGKGHVEHSDYSANSEFSGEKGYNAYVSHYVDLWEAEKARVDAAEKKSEEEALAVYNSAEARAERLRLARDKKLYCCDWIINRHRDQVEAGTVTSLTKEQYVSWFQYRQSLRDLPNQVGFPWLGGGEDDVTCPWPIEPTTGGAV